MDNDGWQQLKGVLFGISRLLLLFGSLSCEEKREYVSSKQLLRNGAAVGALITLSAVALGGAPCGVS